MEEINEENCITKMFENHTIEILCEEINDKKIYYFRATDIGNLLGLTNIRIYITNFDETEKVVKKSKDTSNRIQNITFLTSQGVYHLLYTSKKPLAKKFRKWVAEILDDIIFNESKDLKKKLEETEYQFKFLQMKYNEEIKEKDKEKNWLHYVTLEQVSFNKYLTKTDNIYIGSSEFEHQNDIEKIGNTTNLSKRESNLCSVNASINCFKIRKIYKLFTSMGYYTEKYIHALLNPLKILSGKSTEHFMISQEFADEIISDVVESQNKIIEKINKYIDNLKENNFDFKELIKK